MKVVLATTNRGKVRELAKLLGERVELISLSDAISGPHEVEETGNTFEENAQIKALAAVLATGLPALAEDSGLAVDVLAGAPGVYSARFAGVGASDEQNNNLLLERLAGVPWAERTARFVSVLCLAAPRRDGAHVIGSEVLGFGRGEVEGRITLEPSGTLGFGYDPLFEPLTTPGRTTGEMALEEKNELSHRGRAVKALLPRLLEWLGPH
jgi:XTP/dITP diphosphohydrolase